MDGSTYLVQLHVGSSQLPLWNYREGGRNTLVKGPSDSTEWTAVSLCRVNEQHSLCWWHYLRLFQSRTGLAGLNCRVGIELLHCATSSRDHDNILA